MRPFFAEVMVIEPGKYRLALGYVPQDIHANLTVYQALFYSARLRLPPDFTNDDIDERIRSVLAQLHLEGTENVLIGSPEKKGISGGQRKRVNLAMELLTDPLVLFLDEPTSGLSSEDALVVMKVLRELANQARRSSSQFISRARRFSSCSTTW